jgi:hypothetical protein
VPSAEDTSATRPSVLPPGQFLLSGEPNLMRLQVKLGRTEPCPGPIGRFRMGHNRKAQLLVVRKGDPYVADWKAREKAAFIGSV